MSFALIPQMALYTDRLYYEKQLAYHYVQSANSTMRNDGYRAKWHDMDAAISILQTALAPRFPAETEYLCFMHYLNETSLRYYGARHDAEIDAIADWMRQRYPHWRCNPYVRERASRRMNACSPGCSIAKNTGSSAWRRPSNIG